MPILTVENNARVQLFRNNNK